MNAYLQITQLTKDYGARRALAEVSLSIERGSVVAVLGPNGAGKSTLFGCLLRLTAPTTGAIQFNGEGLAESTRARFGYVAERVSLYSHRTVAENVEFFTRLKGHSAGEVEAQLQRVGLLQARGLKVRQLSKGMLQRLGLAIALCGQPEVMVLDEPFNGLDPEWLDTLQILLREENERGATLLVSTHTMSAVEPLATHVAILLQGRLVEYSRLEQLRADHPEADSLETIYHRIARERRTSKEVLA